MIFVKATISKTDTGVLEAVLMNHVLTEKDFANSIKVSFVQYLELAFKLLMLTGIFVVFWKGLVVRIRNDRFIEQAQIEAMDLDQEEANIIEEMAEIQRVQNAIDHGPEDEHENQDSETDSGSSEAEDEEQENEDARIPEVNQLQVGGSVETDQLLIRRPMEANDHIESIKDDDLEPLDTL